MNQRKEPKLERPATPIIDNLLRERAKDARKAAACVSPASKPKPVKGGV